MELCKELETEKESRNEVRVIHENYISSVLNQLHYYQRRAEDILRKQVFSQRMVENLINDLLDLAKLENSSFVLDKSYFNLTDIIY